MTKTHDPTPSLDPQTLAMIHQAAHEAMLPQMDRQGLKQLLALDQIQAEGQRR